MHIINVQQNVQEKPRRVNVKTLSVKLVAKHTTDSRKHSP